MNKFIKSLSILIVISPLFAGCNSTGGLKGDLSLDIYATNDFHGAIENQDRSMGLGYLGTFMKRKGEQDNTLLIDQGDSWQGSIYSNYNRGALVNDVMCYAKFDSRTVGNHDFDWGIDALVENTNRSYNGYTIPVLAANVYDYDFAKKEMGNVQQSEIGQKHIIYTLENGLKVGIVGVIGENQITSITSSYVQNIGFKDHIEVVKEEAAKMRNDGCDIIIASAHTGAGDMMSWGLEKYVDLVLCGHTHQREIKVQNELTYAQFGCYGRYIGHIKMTYNKNKKKVVNTIVTSFDKNQITSEIKTIDPTIQQLIDTYNTNCNDEADVILANNASYFSQGEHAPNLMCKAIYDQCVNEGFSDVILSYCNTARYSLPSGKWTYSSLYQSFPFDNAIYIASVKGSDILYEIKGWNNVYYNPTFDYKIDPDQYYKIACLDYLLFHTNVYRNYDYFSSFDGHVEATLKENYRVILKNWLIENGYQNSDKALSANDYSSSLSSFNRSLLTTSY